MPDYKIFWDYYGLSVSVLLLALSGGFGGCYGGSSDLVKSCWHFVDVVESEEWEY